MIPKPLIQKAFLQYLDDPDKPILFEEKYRDDLVTIRHSDYWLCGALWDGTDLLPAEYCHKLNLPENSTFGQAARQVKPDALEYWDTVGDTAPMFHISTIRPGYTGN